MFHDFLSKAHCFVQPYKGMKEIHNIDCCIHFWEWSILGGSHDFSSKALLLCPASHT